MNYNNRKPIILIVDDKPENLSVLFSLLDEKYEVLAAENGLIALEIIETSKPDMILLDIMMPEMDGYELCTILKSNDSTKDIPIIFMSALSETTDKVRGLELGAIDYITKPFQKEEVVARIKTHLSIKFLQEELSGMNRNLENMVHDRTKKLQLEIQEKENLTNELKESEKRFRALFEGAPDAILLIDQESGDIVDGNQAAAELVETELIDLIGTNETQLFVPTPEDQNTNANMPFHIKGRKRIYKNNLRKKNGTIVPVEVSVKTLVVGSDLYLLAIVRDISERIKYEIELTQQRNKAEEMNRLKSIFLANMSHELRTPLISILGFSNILSEELNDEEHREMAEDIKKSGDRLLATFNTLLDLIDIESGKVSPKNIKIVLKEVLDELYLQYQPKAQMKQIDFSIDCDEKIRVYGDRRMVSEILKNILDNAIKYTKKGSVKISSESILIDNDPRVLVSINDTGIGIREEMQSVIFQEFRQGSEGMSRSYEGVGLGLTISKKFAELINAKISLSSTEGKGSSFRVEFLGVI
ncbi:MAG: hypothetical protein Fur0015_03990 [Ignavibacteriales bacterium]